MLSKKELMKLYQMLCESRLTQETMVENNFGDYYDVGEEAINVGSIAALSENDFVTQYFRGEGTAVRHKAGLSLQDLMAMWMRKKLDGMPETTCIPTNYYPIGYNVISYFDGCLGSQDDISCGVALAQKYSQTGNVVLVFIGDGATNKGNFHEVLTFASLKKLPLIYMVRSNGWAMSMSSERGIPIKHVSDMANSYGIASSIIDGNDVITVYEEVKKAADWVKVNGPMIIEAKTYRMSSHSTHDEDDYRNEEMFKPWKGKDPLMVMEKYLHLNGFTTEEIDNVKKETKKKIVESIELAKQLPPVDVNNVLKLQKEIIGNMWRGNKI